jgi:hypothetical protein
MESGGAGSEEGETTEVEVYALFMKRARNANVA